MEFAGAIYHVTARGNDRRPIFQGDHDRQRFLAKLGENVETHGIRLYAYVLMGNHFHFLFETPRANLSAFMHQFNSSYTVYYNRRHRRNGHLFEGRYKAKLVEGDPYLLSLARYIHLNPVKVGSCTGRPLAERRRILRSYVWSSHRAYTGAAARDGFVDYGPLLSLVSAGVGEPGLRFREFVEGGLAKNDVELQDALARSSKAVGREDFCRSMETEHCKRLDQVGRKQDASMRRFEVGVSADAVLDAVCRAFDVSEDSLKKRRNIHPSRMVAMKLLKDCSGMNHRAIAQALGIVDGSGVSRTIAALNALMAEDRQVSEMYASLKNKLLNH